MRAADGTASARPVGGDVAVNVDTKPEVRVRYCGICHVLVAAWKTVCWRCATKMAEGWPA